jgi:hypothetical protein
MPLWWTVVGTEVGTEERQAFQPQEKRRALLWGRRFAEFLPWIVQKLKKRLA